MTTEQGRVHDPELIELVTKVELLWNMECARIEHEVRGDPDSIPPVLEARRAVRQHRDWLVAKAIRDMIHQIPPESMR